MRTESQPAAASPVVCIRCGGPAIFLAADVIDGQTLHRYSCLTCKIPWHDGEELDELPLQFLVEPNGRAFRIGRSAFPGRRAQPHKTRLV